MDKNIKIILASKSPRRKEILSTAGFSFDIISSTNEIDITLKPYSDKLLLDCVHGKSLDVIKKITGSCLIITADTVVVLDNTIIGKPKDKNDAIDTLNKLSNKTHFVATGIEISYIKDKKVIKTLSGIEKTNVTFNNLTYDMIIDYLDKEKPYDKAGSYGIQDKSFNFLKSINGNLDNVIGFPMTLFNDLKTKLQV